MDGGTAMITDAVGGTTAVIGLGSPLMGDDGLGLVALERLRACGPFEPELELFDGGTWGMNLLPAIEGAGRLLLIDAIRAGRAPGDLVVIEREALPRGLGLKLSPHQIDLQEVLAVAELRGRLPRTAVAIGLEPERVELGEGLGPAVSRGLDALLTSVIARLAAWGHQPRGGARHVPGSAGEGGGGRRTDRPGGALRRAPRGAPAIPG